MLSGSANTPEGDAEAALAAIVALLQKRGRYPLAQVGEHLRATGVQLPDSISLGDFVLSHSKVLSLSGPPNSKKVHIIGQSTADALAANIQEVLRTHGSMTTAELKLRLSERGGYVPALATLLRKRNETFSVIDGAVSLRRDSVTAHPLSGHRAKSRLLVQPLVRLRSLKLSSSIDASLAANAVKASKVIAIDMDNKAFVLERAVQRAAQQSDVLVFAFSGRTHNPRLSAEGAKQVSHLSSLGRFRLLVPSRDTKNAADFVMSFWMGWLHAHLPAKAEFALISTDIHLERTVADVLRHQGRVVHVSEGSEFDPFDSFESDKNHRDRDPNLE